MQIQKKACKNQGSQQNIGPFYFDSALSNMNLLKCSKKVQIA